MSSHAYVPHTLDPRAPPGMAEKEMKRRDSRRLRSSLVIQGKKMLNVAAEKDYCLPLFVMAATILILSALVNFRKCFPSSLLLSFSPLSSLLLLPILLLPILVLLLVPSALHLTMLQAPFL